MKNVYKLLALDKQAKPTLKTHNNITFSYSEPIKVQKLESPLTQLIEDDQFFVSPSGNHEAEEETVCGDERRVRIAVWSDQSGESHACIIAEDRTWFVSLKLRILFLSCRSMIAKIDCIH